MGSWTSKILRMMKLLLPGKVLMSAKCAGSVGYSAGGLVSYGASAWGSAEMEPDGTTPSGA